MRRYKEINVVTDNEREFVFEDADANELDDKIYIVTGKVTYMFANKHIVYIAMEEWSWNERNDEK